MKEVAAPLRASNDFLPDAVSTPVPGASGGTQRILAAVLARRAAVAAACVRGFPRGASRGDSGR